MGLISTGVPRGVFPGAVINVSRGTGVINLSSLIGGSSGDSVLKRALSKVKPDEGGEAHFRFGKASRFTLTTPEQRTNPTVTVNWPPDDSKKDDEPKDIHIIEYDEIFRQTETLRVENPDDSEQYVMVKNTLRIVFQGRDDGLYRGFNFKSAKET
jgi:hypothetical protein